MKKIDCEGVGDNDGFFEMEVGTATLPDHLADPMKALKEGKLILDRWQADRAKNIAEAFSGIRIVESDLVAESEMMLIVGSKLYKDILKATDKAK